MIEPFQELAKSPQVSRPDESMLRITRPDLLINYSQHGEQEHILDFFGGRIGRFLDLGAGDGIHNSNTRALSDRGWEGVCVEANPFTFVRLWPNHHSNEKIVCICAAIIPGPSTGPGITGFLHHDGELGSCDLKRWSPIREQKGYAVGAFTPDQLAELLPGPFQFVSLDIEGLDLTVFQTMGNLIKDTCLICLEDAVPFTEFDKGYYDKLLSTAAGFGFTKVIAQTGPELGKGNTLIAKPDPFTGWLPPI